MKPVISPQIVLVPIRTRQMGIIDPPHDWGHAVILGRTGFGKGTLAQSLCEHEHDAGSKVLVWDMWRQENTLFCFPEDDPFMLNILDEHRKQPKAFPLEVLMPIFRKEGIKEMKYFVPETWIPCKIPYTQLSRTELLYLMGETTEKAEQILDNIDFSKFRSITELQLKILQLQNKKDILFIVDELGNEADIGDPRIYRTLNRAISSLMSKNIVVSEPPEGMEVYDLDKIQREHWKITSITGRACGSKENFLIFFFNFMSALIIDRQKNPGKYKPCTVYIPEIGNLASGASKEDETIRRLMRFILQESRDAGISMILDSQSPRNIDRSILHQIKKWYIGNLNKDDVEYIHKNLIEIPTDYNIFYEIPELGKGTFVKMWYDKEERLHYRKAERIIPPASHKKRAYEDINKFHVEHGMPLKEVIDTFDTKVRAVFRSERASEMPEPEKEENMTEGELLESAIRKNKQIR